MRVAIVGAGKGGSNLLRMLTGMTRGVAVVGVADRNTLAPGIELARRLGIETTHDFTELVRRPDVDIIVDATGSRAVEDEIRRL